MKRFTRLFNYGAIFITALVILLSAHSTNAQILNATISPDSMIIGDSMTITVTAPGVVFSQGTNTTSCDTLIIADSDSLMMVGSSDTLYFTDIGINSLPMYNYFTATLFVPFSIEEEAYQLEINGEGSCDYVVNDSIYAYVDRGFSTSNPNNGTYLDSTRDTTITLTVSSSIVKFAQASATCAFPGCYDFDRTVVYFAHSGSSDTIMATLDGISSDTKSFTVDFNIPAGTNTGDWSMIVNDTTVSLGSDSIAFRFMEPLIMSAEPIDDFPGGLNTKTLCINNADTLVVDMSGTEPISYVWNYNGSPIPGATLPYLAFGSVDPGSFGSFTCDISDGITDYTTTGVSFNIPDNSIDTATYGNDLVSGVEIPFQVMNTGINSAYYYYTWTSNNGTITVGDNDSAMTILFDSPSSYSVSVVRSSADSVCHGDPFVVNIFVIQGITINTVYLKNHELCTKESVTVPVSISGTPEAYQWQFVANDEDFQTGTIIDIPGADSDTLSISSLDLDDNGSYRLKLTLPSSYSNPTLYSTDFRIDVLYSGLDAIDGPLFVDNGDSCTFSADGIIRQGVYLWSVNGATLSSNGDENEASVLFDKGNNISASISLMVTANGCTDMITRYFGNVGIKELEKANIVLMPNPATEQAKIILPEDGPFDRVEVYNASGILIKTISINGTSVIIPVSDMASGLYIIKVYGDIIYSSKLIVE